MPANDAGMCLGNEHFDDRRAFIESYGIRVNVLKQQPALVAAEIVDEIKRSSR